MAKHLPLLLAAITLCLVCGRVAAADESPAKTDTVAVVFAIEPVVRGQWIGTTSYGPKDWVAADTGFNANSVALAMASGGLKREAKVVDGTALGLPGTSVVGKFFPKGDDDLEARLAALSKEWDVDVVIVIQGTKAADWITHTGEMLEGVGVYTRGMFGARRSQAYCAFSMRTYSRKAQKIVNREKDLRGQQLSSMDWQDAWAGYPALDKKKILMGLEAMTKAGTQALLAKAGLMEAAPETAKGVGSLFIDERARGQSSIPEGNELAIPDGVSLEKARAAVVAGLKGRGWTVASDTSEKITGVLLDGKKEASVEATFTEKTITLVPALHEIRKDGSRVKGAPHLRWHRNLKATVLEELLKASVEDEAPVQAEPAVK